MVEVTLRLPDALYRRARQWAVMTRQELDVVLTDALAVALSPIPTAAESQPPVDSLSDEDVLVTAALVMPAERGQRLSMLTSRQATGTLSAEEQQELLALSQLYQSLWLRQSEALTEAVRRGLRPPLHP